jgi:hypothetical protein
MEHNRIQKETKDKIGGFQKIHLIHNRIKKCARVVTLFGKVTQIQIVSGKMIRSLFRPSA